MDRQDRDEPARAQQSTFQRFSVNTNESLRFEPYVSSDDDEAQPLRRYGAQTLYSDDVFLEEEEENKEGLGESNGVYCTECKTTIQSPHQNHQIVPIAKAAQEMKEELQKTMLKLEEQIGLMENFASHLEEIFITVEENFGRQEQNLEQHYNEVIQTLSQRYDQGATTLQDEKKMKLEGLYGQLVDCGKILDVSKELIEGAQGIYRNEDKLVFLQAVIPALQRIEDFSKEGQDVKLPPTMEFESSPADLSDIKEMMDSVNIVPAPSAPVINPQVPNSATRTSVRVCWSLFSDDTVEFYELHYRPVLDDAAPEELQEPTVSMVKVKETYHTVTHLLPNAQYEFWVTATNTTGVSPASEKAVYMTVPAPPVVRLQECASFPEAALIRWESGNTNPVDSYTLELSEIRSETPSDGITESIVAIPTCECVIQLQPGRVYSVYIRAVNIGGPSEKSESITIQTTGTLFHLLENTAHPFLSITEDGFTIVYSDEDIPLSDMAFSDNTFARCVAVLGELIPFGGRHYWEVEVQENTEFRIGVAYEDTQRNSFLGGNSASWCMRHVLTPSRHKYEFLHNGWTPDIRITIQPQRIGVLLDYNGGKLSFYNADLGQHLYTFCCHFLHHVHPCFALDNPGALTIRNGIAGPKYVQNN